MIGMNTTLTGNVLYIREEGYLNDGVDGYVLQGLFRNTSRDI